MNLLGLIALVLFAGLILGFTLLAARRREALLPLRRIDAFQSLPGIVGQAVETGRRLHFSLGTGTVGQASTAATVAGVVLLDQIAAAAAVSDRPPVVTTADGAATLLAQDVLHGVYARQNALPRFDPYSAQVAGLTPASFGAAQPAIQKDEAVAGAVLVGSVGAEAVLLAESAQRLGARTLAGTDNPTGQALLFATADLPLIGEDVFAGGAYVECAPAHVASLRAQDVLRFVIIGAILLGAGGRTVADLLGRLGLF